MLIVYSTINGLKTIESPGVSYPFRLRMCVRFPNPINFKLSKGLLTWIRVAGLARSPGPISPWVHMTGNFSPVSEMRKGRISLLRVLTRNAKKQHAEAQKSVITFAPVSFGNSYSCITAVKWDAYDVENTADKEKDGTELIRRTHPSFISVTTTTMLGGPCHIAC